MKEILDLKRLKAIQNTLAQKVILKPLSRAPSLVAGVDVAYDLERKLSWGAVVLLRLPQMELVEEAVAVKPTPFPYIPGFLSFREVPVLKEALAQLSKCPEVILVDGQGILHPRCLGLASHLGLEVDLPTVGVAKKPLVGEFKSPAEKTGSWEPIILKGQIKGFVLRSKDKVKPIYISPGHLISLEESLNLVKHCLTGYRLPEPLRLAHLLSQKSRRSARL